MATKKFDLIAQEFVDGIGARFQSAFTPGTGVMPSTNIITAAQVSSYVNRALNHYFETVWKMTEGNVFRFTNYLPELVNPPTSIPFTTGVYNIADPHLHIFDLIGATTSNNKFILIMPASRWSLLQTGLLSMYSVAGDQPVIIKVAGQIYVYPTTITSANVIYIKLPKNGTTGELLTQNGGVDSPYHETRHTEIVTIAKSLYMNDITKTPDK